MKKIMNRSTDVVSQLLNGIAYTHDHLLTRVPKTGIICSKDLPKNQVTVISGGGTGHEPAHSGYVGKNMLAASVNGPVFIPPTAKEIFEAIQLVDQGPGVLMVVKNFEADVAEFIKAEYLATKAGHHVRHIIVNDDCSIESQSFKKRRRGVAGTVLVHKIVTAAATKGVSLDELVLLGEQVIHSLNTLGVALSSATKPGEEQPHFFLAPENISFGIGIHGEKGYREEPLVSSEVLANELINKLKAQYQLHSGSRLAVLVNGLGSTPLMELYIFTNDVRRLLELEGYEVCFKKVGNYMTSLDMQGVSLTFLEVKDDKWVEYLQMPVETYNWH